MLERTEKTDALLLTNGIYLRAGSQYAIVNILLLTELASPSDDQKLACFLAFFDNMINYMMHNSLNTNQSEAGNENKGQMSSRVF